MPSTLSDPAIQALVVLAGCGLVALFGHRIPGVRDLLRPGAEDGRDPRRRPRFTLAGLMIAIILLSLPLAVGAWFLRGEGLPAPPAMIGD
jgi:hypothetical protein